MKGNLIQALIRDDLVEDILFREKCMTNTVTLGLTLGY
jgi:hypothetical protein